MYARTAVAAVLAGASVGALFLSAPTLLTGVALADAQDGCSSGSLLPVLLASGAISHVGLAEPTCDGDWAMASTTSGDPGAQNASVLFHRVNGAWQYVTYGSYWDCVGASGVPPAIAARFAGCFQHQ